MISNTSKYTNRVCDFISYICILFAATATMYEDLNSYGLFVAIPLAFCCCFISYNTLTENKYLRILLALYLWLCVSYAFTWNIEAANGEMRKVFGCFILSYTIASMAQKNKNISWLYIVYCVLLIFTWKYAYENIIDDIIFGEQRLNDDTLNANHLAYYTFYVTICIYVLGDITHTAWIRRVFRILFWGIIILSFYTAIFTASRQVLLIQVPLFLILILYRYIVIGKTTILTRTLLLIAATILAMYAYSHYGQSIYDDSLLKERSSANIEDDDRMHVAKEALELFIHRPIVGYGPGNAMHYISNHVFTHNTFLELLVNSGIIGMLIFAYMIISFIATQFRRLKLTKDKTYILFIIFGCFWLIDQFFYVFYVDLWLISFFILVATHSDTYYKNNRRITQVR